MSSIPAADESSVGRVAGIDYGDVRIGIALSDGRRTLASPHENYTRSGPQADAARFRRLVKDEEVARFVVGLPVHTNGAEGRKAAEARAFGIWLQETTGLPVEYFDERFTTVQAEEYLLHADLTRKRRKARRDMLAAQIMLTAWLESRNRGADSILGLDE